MSFELSNHSLKVWESIGTPTRSSSTPLLPLKCCQLGSVPQLLPFFSPSNSRLSFSRSLGVPQEDNKLGRMVISTFQLPSICQIITFTNSHILKKINETIYFSPIKIDGKLIQVCVYINIFHCLSFPYVVLSFTSNQLVCNLLNSFVKTILQNGYKCKLLWFRV